MQIKGFKFSAVDAAIKKPGRPDFALIYSEAPANTAAVFTQNCVKAAPVLISAEHIKSGLARAIVVNSGNANACTGEQGMQSARETVSRVAEALAIADETVQICSTGVVGLQMPMERIRTAVPALIEGLANGSLADVSEAIMTTDTFPKMESRAGEAGAVKYTLAGIAKGSGMIMPNMATMLAFIITDAAIDTTLLENIFRRTVETSFNSITVDGDTSTNDTCLIMANGMAENRLITKGTAEAVEFEKKLHEVLLSLAKQIVKDGEGATKFIEIRVSGAKNDPDAKKVAMAIANSSLVKTAFYGQDANWGRIFVAAGYSGVDIDQSKLSLSFDNVCMAKNGLFAGGNAEELGSLVLKKKEFTVTLDLGFDDGKATVYTSDLSHEYISINADYRT